LSLDDARRKIEDWRQYYNETRPHSALQWATPAEFARQAREKAMKETSGIAKASGATTIYTGDRGLAKCAGRNNLKVVLTWDLPLPPDKSDLTRMDSPMKKPEYCQSANARSKPVSFWFGRSELRAAVAELAAFHPPTE
jgi:hypothetical protein